jgi:hypothetical protein
MRSEFNYGYKYKTVAWGIGIIRMFEAVMGELKNGFEFFWKTCEYERWEKCWGTACELKTKRVFLTKFL